MKKLSALTLTILLLAGCSEDLQVETDLTEVKKEEVKPVIEQVEEPVETVVEAMPLTADEQKYMDVISEAVATFGEKMDAVSTLTTEAESNPAVTADEEWKNQINGNFMIVTMLTTVLADMADTNNVPARFEVAHEYTLNAFTLMSMAGDKMSQAVENGNDEGLMLEGKEFIDESNLELDKVIAEFDRISLEINGA